MESSFAIHFRVQRHLRALRSLHSVALSPLTHAVWTSAAALCLTSSIDTPHALDERPRLGRPKPLQTVSDQARGTGRGAFDAECRSYVSPIRAWALGVAWGRGWYVTPYVPAWQRGEFIYKCNASSGFARYASALLEGTDAEGVYLMKYTFTSRISRADSSYLNGCIP
ncbi:hypothetical protein K438DRAFT_97331 [Mycena galopus ATCC 62051]|nr:hypothetical protein K438DRAFT_97331 [Mycena galopus ATCC 62051]